MNSKILFGYLIFVILISFSKPYNTEYRRQYSYESKPQQLCCIGAITLSTWAQSHYKDVRIVANIMRQQYFVLTQGGQQSISAATYPTYGGKTEEEMKVLIRQHVEYIVNEVHSNRLTQNQVSQTNFFENEAANLLERLEQQQEQSFSTDQVETIDNNYNNVKHITFPTEVHTVGDQTYILKKNCTTTTTNNMTPITILSANERETYNEGTRNTNHMTVHQVNPYLQSSSVHSIYNYLKRQESQVPNWTPQVVINEETSNKYNNMRTNTPAVVIPVASNLESQVETFNQQNLNRGTSYHPNYFNTESAFNLENQHTIGQSHINTYQPSSHSTVTIKQYNRTVTPGSDGRPIVAGGESETMIENGKVVFNNYRPFGSIHEQHIEEESWMKNERERLFWLFQNQIVSNTELKRWQSEQEDRLHQLAFHYNTTIEQIEEWQRQELDRFNTFVHEQTLLSENLEEWQIKEKARLRWLIEQNSLTTKELENWQRKNQHLLNSLASEYRISISQLKEWQKNQLDQVYETINLQTSELDTLKQWQNQERDRLYTVIKQHNVTVEELQEQIRRDQDRLKDISQQYHVNIAEMEKWLKNELHRLTTIINQQQEEIKRLTEWQRQERLRLEQITQQHNLTVEELTEQLKHDKHYLNNLAHKYHVSIEELEAWQRKEIDRLRNIGTITIENQLKEWQQRERDRLMLIAQQNDYTIEEFENKIKQDRIKLQRLAEQYQVRVEEVEEWIKTESNRLHSAGLLKNVEEELNEWQTRERDRLLLIVKQNEVNVEELERRIKNDNQHLQNLAIQYQVQVREVEEWIKKEIERLKSQGLVKIENLEEWQKLERNRLNNFILQNQLTIEEFEQSVLKDRTRLQNLAYQYHVQLEEVENFIKNEINRLKFENSQNIGELKKWQENERHHLEQIVLQNHLTLEELKKQTIEDRQFLQNLAIQYQTNLNEIEQFVISEINRLQSLGFVKVTEQIIEEEILTDWQEQERQNLEAYVTQHHVSVDELIQKIKNDRYRLEKLAYQYQLTVEEIEEWFKKEIDRLLQQQLIYETEILLEWQKREREYLQKILTQQKWSYEELERKIKNNQERLKTLASQYHITIQQLIDWYTHELNRLRDSGEIYNENLIDWQRQETERIYQIVTHHTYTLQQLERLLWENEENLIRLAQSYRTEVHKLKEFQRLELERLLNLGLIGGGLSEWQNEERIRLNLIVKEFRISEEELSEFLRYDREFHSELAKKYGISLEILEAWHVEELKRLQNEGKFDTQVLINLEYWQKRERDRLYMLIRNQQITINELIKWQSDLQNLQHIANQYNIHVEELRRWQLKELNRLYKLARYYRMSIKELAEFRQSELDRLKILAHSVTMANNEYMAWLEQERQRFALLSERYQLSLIALDNWRRILFLLSQGLLHRNFDTDGGQFLDNRYNATGRHNISISYDRGDQPPNVFLEDYDEQEPYVYGQKPTDGPVQEREPTTARPIYRPIQPSAPLRNPPNYIPAPVPTAGISDTYSMTHRKKVTTQTHIVPVVMKENTDIAGGSSYNYNSYVPGASANVQHHDNQHYYRNNPEHIDRAARSSAHDGQQQQLEVETFRNDDGQQKMTVGNLEDFGQQHMEEYGQQHMEEYYQDLGQQHLVQTNLDEVIESSERDRMSQPHEPNFDKYTETEEVAVEAQQVEQKPTGFWGKVKQKTKDIFG